MKYLGAILLILSTLTAYAEEPKIRFYTEEYPPYNFWQDNRLNGTSTEIIRDVLEKLDWNMSTSDIHLVPWARAYYETLNRPNTAIFSIARTKEREKLFKWIGPIACAKIGIIALKSEGIIINSPDELAKHRVGVVREDVGHQLMRLYVTDDKMDISNSSESNLRKMKKNRIKLFAYDLNVVNGVLKKCGLDPNEFETVYILDETPFYIGFNLDTDISLFRQFETAFEEVISQRHTPDCR